MFPHIVSDPAILSGKPCILGTRLSVEFLLELIASGASIAEIVQAYPQVSSEEVEDAMQYATHLLEPKKRPELPCKAGQVRGKE